MSAGQTLAEEFAHLGGATYVKDYRRGWKASANPEAVEPLEAADRRGETNAWYDGYMDLAAGRAKWHIPRCPNHASGECGEG